MNKQKCVGILGGGQLGQMFALAAAEFGYSTLALSPESSPIIARCARHIKADYVDTVALDQLRQSTQAITIEFENIPSRCLDYLEKTGSVFPDKTALTIAQDRQVEKSFLRNQAQVPVGNFWIINKTDDLITVPNSAFPAILKTSRNGYDGKGQVKVETMADLASAWQKLNQVPAILEAFVNFDREFSIIIARDVFGSHSLYGPLLNEHTHHILTTSWSHGDWSEQLQDKAREAAITIARALDYKGVLCVEYFDCGGDILINEIAPRPHNSGHLTIEGFTTSQFQQQVRATLGFPIVEATPRCYSSMINLIGFTPNLDLVHTLLKIPKLHWHWYGKTNTVPGRKMGHITLESDSIDELHVRTAYVQQLLAQHKNPTG